MFMTIDRTRYLTLQEAKKQSKYTYNHLRRLVKEGAIKILDIAPRSYLIDWLDLQRYMGEKKQRRPYPKGEARQTSGKGKSSKNKVHYEDVED